MLRTWEGNKPAVVIASEIESAIAAYLATITMMNLLVEAGRGAAIATGLSDVHLWLRPH